MGEISDEAVIGVRYEGDRVWIDVCDADGVHSALAPPELDSRRIAALRAASSAAWALHQGVTMGGRRWCAECHQSYPCATARALAPFPGADPKS